MSPRGSTALVMLAACMLAAGCSGGSRTPQGAEPVGEAQDPTVSRMASDGAGRLVAEGVPRWWSVASAAEMIATGIEVEAMSGVDALVVDGAGDAWLAGPWQLTRVRPQTGESQSWDISDDVTFAAQSGVRPARAGGVWLMLDDRLRLFDGQRFMRDLPVPAAFRGGEGGSVNDMLEVGSEIWVSSPAGVARCTGDTWSLVGPGEVAGAGPMAVDSAGFVWTLAQTWTGIGLAQQILRFDGTTWGIPDAEGAPVDASEIVAGTRGDMLARSGSQVFRFDGQAWGELTFAPEQAVARRQLVDLAVAPGGDMWALGPEGLARAPVEGPWTRVVAVDGTAVGVGAVDEHILVADSAGLSRVEGDRLERLWSAPRRGPVASMNSVVAVSSDEAWVAVSGGLGRMRAGRWEVLEEPLIPDSGSGVRSGPDLVRATDAAVWAITGPGLVRYQGDDRRVFRRDRPDERLLPGPDGSVWAAQTRWPGWTVWYSGDREQGRTLTRIHPDGHIAEVELPGVAWSLTSLTAGADGSLWATICADNRSDYCTEPDLVRWNGSWASVPYPGTRVTALAVALDGGLWATLVPDEGPRTPVLARYVQGTWSSYPDVPVLHDPVLAPDGSLCGVRATPGDLLCVDEAGAVRNLPMGIPGTVDVGVDGSVWVVDRGQVARLPVTIER